jgi:hypothetical protein
MADGSAEQVVAVNACPYCGLTMPDRTEEDYRLAPCGMGGAWSAEFGRSTTGVWFLEDCPGCGEFLAGTEYRPELIGVEFRPGQTNVLVFDRWIAWYGQVGAGQTERRVWRGPVRVQLVEMDSGAHWRVSGLSGYAEFEVVDGGS